MPAITPRDSGKVQPTTRRERAARSPAGKLGHPEVNALLHSIERSFAGGKSATAGICDTLNERSLEYGRSNGGIKIRQRDGAGVNAYPHNESTAIHDHLRCGLAWEDTRDWSAEEQAHTASIAPAAREALASVDVASIPTARGVGASHPETLPVTYQKTGEQGRSLDLRLDGVRHHYSKELSENDIDTRDVGDLLGAEEESYAGLGAALSGAPSWITAGVLLAWLAGDVCPKHLARCKAMPSDKTIAAGLTAACKRFAEWRQAGTVTAAQIAAGKDALRLGSPLLEAISRARRGKCARDHASRMGADAAKVTVIRGIESERQASVTASERESWLGKAAPVAPRPLFASGLDRALYEVGKQKQRDQRTIAIRSFEDAWWLENGHKVPPEIVSGKRFTKKSKTVPPAAPKGDAIGRSTDCSAPSAYTPTGAAQAFNQPFGNSAKPAYQTMENTIMDEYWRIAKVAALANVTTKTVENEIRRGNLRRIKIGRSTVFDQAEVMRWIGE